MSETQFNLEQELCKALCARVTLHYREDGNVLVETPFKFPDGDAFSIYLKRLPAGGIRLSDMGSTLMHLSYDQDIDKLRDGTRAKVFTQILAEMGLSDEDGELILEAPINQLGQSVFHFGQALTRIHDLTFLNRVQVESTFYEDLYERISQIVGSERVIKDYVAPGVPKAEDYKADFCIENSNKPLLVFGVPNQTKARLATIVMQHLRHNNFRFRGMVVYSDMTAISRSDVSRLTTAANDQVPSLEEYEALEMKIKEALSA